MSKDFYEGYPLDLEAPAHRARAVTTSDTVDLPFASRALYIGGEGNLSLITINGDTVAFTGIPAGFILPVRVSRVRATGTTATEIVALA